MIDRMLERQFDPLAVRENFSDFLGHALPFTFAPKIVHHQEAAVQQIFSQRGHLVVVERERARLDHVDEWVIGQIRVGQPKVAAVRINLDGSHLLQAEGQDSDRCPACPWPSCRRVNPHLRSRRMRTKVNTSFSKPGALVHLGVPVLCEGTSRAVLASSGTNFPAPTSAAAASRHHRRHETAVARKTARQRAAQNQKNE